MVLEQKNSPGDYGSIEKTQASGTRVLENTASSDITVAPVADTIVPSEAEPLVQEAHQPLIQEEWAEENRLYNTSSGLSSPRSVKIDIHVPAPSREEPRFPREKCKTFFAFLFLAANMVLTTITLALVHERVPSRDKYGPLPDVVLDNVSQDWGWGLYTSEILIMVSSSAAFLVILFHKHRYIVMRRVFIILGMLYLMRSITMYVTVLPMANTTYYCSPKANTTSVMLILRRSMQLLSGFGLSINDTPRRCLLFHWLAGLAALAGMLFILMAKAHYTIDVIIAYYVTTRLFWMYHMLANNKDLKQTGPNNFLSRVWWFFMFKYFERNVNGVVPRQFEWPLSLPRRFFAKHPNRDS